MNTGKLPVGPRGLILLTVTAVAGLALAVYGWSGRGSGVPPGALTGAISPSSPRVPPSASPSGSASPSSSAGPASRTGTPGTQGTTPPAHPGPKLSSQPFASYAFRIWPGARNAAAQAALTGLSISIRQRGSGISVTAGVSGQPGTSRLYPTGARVYVVEASMGDDSGGSDYSLGDDGLVITDAQGRIL
jgi:hypothetical protein